jgi:hypothetical protein
MYNVLFITKRGQLIGFWTVQCSHAVVKSSTPAILMCSSNLLCRLFPASCGMKLVANGSHRDTITSFRPPEQTYSMPRSAKRCLPFPCRSPARGQSLSESWFHHDLRLLYYPKLSFDAHSESSSSGRQDSDLFFLESIATAPALPLAQAVVLFVERCCVLVLSVDLDGK